MPRISLGNNQTAPAVPPNPQPQATPAAADPQSETGAIPPQNPAPQPAIGTTSFQSASTPVDGELKDKSGGLFASFLAFPNNVTFQGEENNETVILLLRQHVVTNIPWIAASIILLLVPTFLFPLVFMTSFFPPVPASYKLVLALFWYAGTFTYAFLNFLYWYFNVYIITNERVVDVDWYSLIYRRAYSAQISKIQDVGSVMSGVVRSIFDFGTVQIETAAEEENLEFDDVPHPALVVQKLEELLQKEEKEWEGRGSV